MESKLIHSQHVIFTYLKPVLVTILTLGFFVFAVSEAFAVSPVLSFSSFASKSEIGTKSNQSAGQDNPAPFSSSPLAFLTNVDTVQVTIPAGTITEYCLDTSVFDIPGILTGAGFCSQGNAATVAAIGLNLECVELAPAAGFSGISPNLICLIHCFNNDLGLCDTTYLEVTVEAPFDCDSIFIQNTLDIPYLGNPTSVCIPLTPTVANTYELIFNGLILSGLQGCDFDSVVVYTYAFLVGGGFNGPYILNAWTVNGITYTGFFNNVFELVDLMNAFDPTGNWQINTQASIIFGGNLAHQYGNIQLTHVPTGSESIQMTNFSIVPNGFIVNLTSINVHTLIANDPVTGCSDTLFINPVFDVVTTDTVYLTTNVNTPTTEFCLDGNELPGGNIFDVGFCILPANGAAPLNSNLCVFYVPNLNYAGQDTFCVVVCDNSFPQTCDTTIFIITVLPEKDTVYLTIPFGASSVDTCLDDFVIELPGAITSADFCSIQPGEIDGQVNDNCLTFNTVNNFLGNTQVCVVHCSGSVCDTTIVIITIEPPVNCPEIFSQNSTTILTPNGNAVFCIPISTGEIVNYTVSIDGTDFSQSYTPCGFEDKVFYNYATLGAGPYFLESWSVNGNTFFGNVPDLPALIDSMNVWDPAGAWTDDPQTSSISGGVNGYLYSDLIISQIGVGTDTLTAQFIQVASGSQIPLSGFGTHEIIVTALNGCADTISVVLEPYEVTTDTVYLGTTLNTSISPICIGTSELLGNFTGLTFCSLAVNGTLSIVNDTCVSYLPGLNFVGNDTFCMVVCDDYQQQICDTLVVIATVEVPVDTIYIEATTVEPFDTCLTGDVLQLPGPIAITEVCGANPAEVATTFNGNCVIIDLTDNFEGTTTICVVHCTADVPAVCDTTIIVVNYEGVVVPCPEIFNPDQVFISLDNDTGQVCLPVSITNIFNYEILLDGNPYNGGLAACDFDSAFIYFHGLVFGQGNQGPYSVTWNAYGNTFSATVPNISTLVGFMNDWDPAGDWVLNPNTFTIVSSNHLGIYGTLTITHIATGMISSLGADFSGIPAGTMVQITGVGQHQIVLIDPVTDCSDTLTVNALDMVNVIDIETVENVPSQVVCLDISDLPGTFTQMIVCQEPQYGMIIMSGNCFTFNPANGFIGNDQACVAVCDDMGNCDTTLLNITVTPLCSLFDFFPDGQQEFQVTDCSDITAYCVPVLLDSISHFGVLDNGIVYTGGFALCNSIYTQIQMDTGYHEIIFIHLNTGCQDTLFANVVCNFDSTGCGISSVSGLSLVVDDCTASAQFCVSVALPDISNFFITDNGVAYNGAVVACDLNSQLAAVQLDTGFHQLIFADTVKGCADTFNVEVKCPFLEDVVIDITVNVDDSDVICLEDLNFIPALIESVVNVCPGNGNATFILDDQIWCITVLGETVGLDTACFQVCSGDTCATVFIHVTVVQPCPDYFPDDFLTGSIPCSLDTGLICLPITLVEMQNKVFNLNSQLYTGPIIPCNFDSIFVLNYSELPNQGNFGPYNIENWMVNGVEFSGSFNSPQEMADSMNIWDPDGNWAVFFDPASQATLVIGGNSQNSYGPMKVIQELTGVEVVLGINSTFIPLGVVIKIPFGTSTLTLTDTVTLCAETVIVQITCVESEVVIDTVLVGVSDTFCLDFSDLLGTVTSIENICPASGGSIVQFTLENDCVIYQGNSPGLDSACYVVCDDVGICDTTYFFITVTTADQQPPVAVNDTIVTGVGTVTTIQVLNNDTITPNIQFTILDPPLHGNAIFLPDGSISYLPEAGYCDDAVPDVFTYQICNSLGCDTATVFVTVQCLELEIFDGFSPNGDGINDFFKINGLQKYPDHKLLVFNRWGNKVFEATDYQNNWEGTWNGKDLPDGTYFYYLELGDGEESRSGFVQINR